MNFFKSRRQSAFITVILVGVPVLLAVTITAFKNKFEKLPVYGEPAIKPGAKEIPHVIQPFSLTQQDGNTFSTDKLENKIAVVDFFFTSCTSVCPKMTAQLKTVADAFNNDPEVMFVSFTVDPESDNPQRLTWYMKQFNIDNTHWHFLTGDKKEIYKLARESFFLTATDGDGGPGDFIHSDKLVLIDKEKRIRGYYTGTDDKATTQLIQDIKKLDNEK